MGILVYYIFTTTDRSAFIDMDATLNFQTGSQVLVPSLNSRTIINDRSILKNSVHLQWHFEMEQGLILENILKA